ncbi:MAG: thiamine phosphate synthase [Lachnospira sp.]|nr:thiamine phosphate synthase [Lachnospira sp.]
MNEKIYRICITNRHLVSGFDEMVTDSTLGNKESASGIRRQQQCYLKQVECALSRKPNLLILREKDLTEQEYEALAVKVLNLCKRYQVECILNSYANVAIRLGVPRIHLPMWQLRKLTMEERKHFQKIGVSVHSVEEAVEAEKCRVDYIIAGHIFATDCKKGVPPRGLGFLEEVCRMVFIPVYAIGGIHEDNAKDCVDAGAAGVCMMSEYMKD